MVFGFVRKEAKTFCQLTTQLRSSKQEQRRGQQRLDKSLDGLSTHPCWSAGLGISSALSALKPELVLNVDHEAAAAALKNGFGYEKDAEENCPGVKPLFKSCVELHPGLCRSDVLYDRVLLLVNQWKAHLEIEELSALTLFQLEVHIPQSASAKPAPEFAIKARNWYLLGSVRKRPVCFILAKFIPLGDGTGLLVPEVDAAHKHFTLLTCYEILLACLRLAKELCEDKWEAMQIRVSSHAYEVVGCSQTPNHLSVGGERSAFMLGPSLAVPVARKPRAPQAAAGLRFGLDAILVPAKKGKKRKRKQKATACDLPQEGSAAMALSADTAFDARFLGNSSDSDNANDFGAGEWTDVADTGNFDAFPAKLNLIQYKQLKEAVKASKGCEEDEAEEEANKKTSSASSAKSSSGTASGKSSSSKPPALDLARAGESDRESQAGAGAFFNTRLGIIAMNQVKRKCACCICKQALVRDETRFQVSLDLKKPEKSIHPGCAANLPEAVLRPSFEWVREQLGGKSGMRHSDSDSRILTETSQRLQCMMNASKS